MLLFANHLFIVVGFLLKVWLLFQLILATSHAGERIVRGAALGSGILIVVACESFGISYPQLMFYAFEHDSKFLKAVGGVLAPATVGIAVSRYCFQALKADEVVAVRLMILFGVLSLGTFVALYAKTVSTGLHTHSALMPNTVFTLAVSLYAVLNYRPTIRTANM